MTSGTRLFVGNLPENTNDKELIKVFSSFGNVVNLDIKCKSDENTKKNFAFVTLSGSNHDIESCIKHFTVQSFNGNNLYVTRARESFLERLQRERLETQHKETAVKESATPKKNPVIKLSEKLNPRKRKADLIQHGHDTNKQDVTNPRMLYDKPKFMATNGDITNGTEPNKKKLDSDMKRMESLKQKRQEFKQKQMIIKSGLVGIDSMQNKKKKFTDSDEEIQTTSIHQNSAPKSILQKRTSLFDGDDSGDEVNFEIKKQFEGKQGQKVLDLQSRYKSDKRFVLDERFIEENESENEAEQDEAECVDVGQSDEKARQLNILQDVLGVTIKSYSGSGDSSGNKRTKPKTGMLRYDPLQPEHSKFLAPVEEKPEDPKKIKKKKNKEKQEDNEIPETPPVQGPIVEVSKEQFYKVSNNLEEAIAQPAAFSLRSLFSTNEEEHIESPVEQEESYIQLQPPKQSKVKNPLDQGEKNPFVYDSSESEDEEVSKEKKVILVPEKTEPKVVWRENFFFTETDIRLKDALAFFNKTCENEGQKERRELKSLMKKRIYNNERKNQMFKKKIGGKKKSMKKSFIRKT